MVRKIGKTIEKIQIQQGSLFLYLVCEMTQENISRKEAKDAGWMIFNGKTIR